MYSLNVNFIPYFFENRQYYLYRDNHKYLSVHFAPSERVLTSTLVTSSSHAAEIAFGLQSDNFLHLFSSAAKLDSILENGKKMSQVSIDLQQKHREVEWNEMDLVKWKNELKFLWDSNWERHESIRVCPVRENQWFLFSSQLDMILIEAEDQQEGWFHFQRQNALQKQLSHSVLHELEVKSVREARHRVFAVPIFQYQVDSSVILLFIFAEKMRRIQTYTLTFKDGTLQPGVDHEFSLKRVKTSTDGSSMLKSSHNSGCCFFPLGIPLLQKDTVIFAAHTGSHLMLIYLDLREWKWKRGQFIHATNRIPATAAIACYQENIDYEIFYLLRDFNHWNVDLPDNLCPPRISTWESKVFTENSLFSMHRTNMLNMVNNSSTFPDVLFSFEEDSDDDDTSSTNCEYDLPSNIICAHRGILVSRSDYFAKMFSGDFAESKLDSPIPIDFTSKRIFIILLQHLYANVDMKLSLQQYLELYLLSDRMDLQDLKSLIEAHVVHYFPHDMPQVFSFADQFNLSDLKSICRSELQFNISSCSQCSIFPKKQLYLNHSSQVFQNE